MSSKHLFPKPEGLVSKALRGLISYNPDLALIEASRVVFDTKHDQNTVSIISGGGAGHEPAWAGYVGQNMLAASASGDIFASPSTKQILEAIDAVPSNKGTILVVTNYTGDCLHFGLAREKADATNKSPCGMIICGDDVSVGKKGGLVGRRGLASQILVLKVLGAASAAGCSFDECMSLGQAVSTEIASIAATLDHCHVPGRSEHATLGQDEIELGTGPHNEPGYKKISPVPSPEDFLGTVLKYCLDESDPERGYVRFEKGDEIILLVSNFGGISPLEMGAITDELLEQLEKTYSIRPVRIYNGPLETSLNAPAFSTSLINLTAAAKNTSFSTKQMLDFLEVRTTTSWEAVAGSQITRRPRKQQIASPPKEPEKTIETDLKYDPDLLESMCRQACDNLIKAEPDLTKWDTVMGDGDCGETLKTGATALQSALDSGVAKGGSAIAVLQELENIVESKMGGTLGGILGIFFVSLTTSLQRNSKSVEGVELWGKAMTIALSNLQNYTPAKVGDRTVMDVLIPFAETMEQKGDFGQAVDAAVKGAESTKHLQPKLGRATYVGGMEGKDLPPDPGAWGATEAIRGLQQGMSK